jgi:transposase
MASKDLNDKAWNKANKFLASESRLYRGNEATCRGFLEAVIWIARSGAPWRMLPETYGNWNTIYKRFARWEKHGVFERMMKYFSQDRDFKVMMLDSTIVRAHPSAAGALKKTAGRNIKP